MLCLPAFTPVANDAHAVGDSGEGVVPSARTPLARPLETIAVQSAADAVNRVARRVADLAAEEDGVSTIVVGLPVRLDGTPSEQSSRVRAFIDALTGQTAIPIVVADERLTSREA